MNTTLVLLALVGCALAQVPQDTPEVAAAKAHFFHRYAAEAHRNTLGYGYGHLGYAHHGYAPFAYGHHGYTPIAHHGYAHHGLAHAYHGYVPHDTPEVHAAKVAHFAAHAEARAALADHRRKRSAQAPEPVEDTAEVAAAKANFNALFEKAAAAAEAAPDYPEGFDNHGHLGSPVYAYHGLGHLGYATHGLGYAHHGYAPLAHHGLGHLGYAPLAHHGLIHKRSTQAPEPVEDTPEVAAAKAAFTATYEAQAAAAEAAPDFDLDGKISTHSGHLSAIDGKLTTYGYGHYPYGHLGYAHHGYSPLALGYAGHHGLGHFGYAHHGLGHLVHKRSASHPRRYHHYGYPRYSHHRYHARSYHH